MGRLTTSDGRQLAYRKVGDGLPFVCHGGGPGFSASYLRDLGGLDDHVGLVLLDPRGTGDSDRPDDASAYDVDHYVDDLEELRRHLGIERLLLLGHSHGGIVAMAYAAAHPDRVERLVLASTLARFSAAQRDAMEAAMERCSSEPWYEDACAALAAEEAGDYADERELAEIAFREFPFYFARYGDEARAYLETIRDDTPNPDPLKLFNAQLETFDLRPVLPRITAPTLVITGEHDFITGPVCAAEIAEGIAGAETVILPDTGHFVFVESPEAWRDAVLSFLGVEAAA